MKSKLVLLSLILAGFCANAENWTNYPFVTKPGSTNDTFLLGSVSAHTNQQLKAGDLLSWTRTNIYAPTTNQYAYFNSVGQLVGTNNGGGWSNITGSAGSGFPLTNDANLGGFSLTNGNTGVFSNLYIGSAYLTNTFYPYTNFFAIFNAVGQLVPTNSGALFTNLSLGGNVIDSWNDVTNYFTQTGSGGVSLSVSNRFTGIVNFAGAIMVESTNTPGIDFNYRKSSWSTNANWQSTFISGPQKHREYDAFWTNTSAAQITNTLPASMASVNDSNAVISVLPIPGNTTMRVHIESNAATNYTIEYFGANNFTMYSIVKAAGTATAGQMLLSDGAGRYTNATPAVGSVSSAGSNVFFYAVDGAYNFPAYTFASDTNTGIWLEPGGAGSNSLNFGINGGVDGQETYMRIYPGIGTAGPRLQIYGDVEMIAGARFYQNASEPDTLAFWDSSGALNTSGLNLSDLLSLTNLLHIYETNLTAGQPVVSDGAGGFTSGPAGGGSATNLTPWTSAINGAGNTLSNFNVGSDLLMKTDNIYDIGTAADFRPRFLYASAGVVTYDVTAAGGVAAGTPAKGLGTLAATNALWLGTNVYVPTPSTTGGWLWNSNQVLFWITGTKTNLISDGR